MIFEENSGGKESARVDSVQETRKMFPIAAWAERAGVDKMLRIFFVCGISGTKWCT